MLLSHKKLQMQPYTLKIQIQPTYTNAATGPKVYALKITLTEYIIHTLRREVGGAGQKLNTFFSPLWV